MKQNRFKYNMLYLYKTWFILALILMIAVLIGVVKQCHLIDLVILIFSIIDILLVFVWSILTIVDEVRSIIRNIIGSEVSIFKTIDYYKLSWSECNCTYLKMVGIVNYIYESDDFKKLMKNKRLDLLYERKDKLEKRLMTTADFFNSFAALIISILAAVAYDYFKSEEIFNEVNCIIFIIGLLATMFGFTFGRYIFIGSSKSYKDNVWKYELSLLNDKIRELHEHIKVADLEELKKQQYWIDKLIKEQNKSFRIPKHRKNDEVLQIIENFDFTKIDL